MCGRTRLSYLLVAPSPSPSSRFSFFRQIHFVIIFTDLFFGAESMPRIYTHVMYILVCVHVLHNKKSQKSET